jgi:cysteine desulfurase/selenocysteine lyase
MKRVRAKKMDSKKMSELRSEFPILSTHMNSAPLVYLDNAATLQKPRRVVESLQSFYFEKNANVHRSVHRLGQEATDLYESVRQTLVDFLGFGKTNEVIFTKGTTDAINLIARGIENQIRPGDLILLTRMEHHANFVPWQQLARRRGATLSIVELDSDYRLDMQDFVTKLSKKPKVVSFTGVSNVLGVVNPVEELSSLAKKAGAWVVMDGAQSLTHFQELSASRNPDFDFLAFSAHKLGGPTGVGALWGRQDVLELLEPSSFGGDMILEVFDSHSIWNELPWRLEAGTPNIADVIAMGESLRFLEALKTQEIAEHEQDLVDHGLELLSSISQLKIFGPLSNHSRVPIFSFQLEGIHPHDLGSFLDQRGIAVRAGNHCAHPLHQRFGWGSSTRASCAFYNEVSELEKLKEGILEAQRFFNRGQKVSHL